MHEIVEKSESTNQFQSSNSTALYADTLLATQALQAHLELLHDVLKGKVREGGALKQFPLRLFVSTDLDRVCRDTCVAIREVWAFCCARHESDCFMIPVRSTCMLLQN